VPIVCERFRVVQHPTVHIAEEPNPLRQRRLAEPTLVHYVHSRAGIERSQRTAPSARVVCANIETDCARVTSI
jgi:hypothetical protein